MYTFFSYEAPEMFHIKKLFFSCLKFTIEFYIKSHDNIKLLLYKKNNSRDFCQKENILITL